MDMVLALNDVAEMVRAATFLKDCGIMSLGVTGCKHPSIHIGHEGVLAVATASGETPVISESRNPGVYRWRAEVEFNGVTFYCLLDSDGLSLFGYEPEWPSASFKRIRQVAT